MKQHPYTEGLLTPPHSFHGGIHQLKKLSNILYKACDTQESFNTCNMLQEVKTASLHKQK